MNLRLSTSAKYLTLLLLLAGCKKVVDYPDIPAISFTSLISQDSTDVLQNPVKRVTLSFHLTDGDGNIGLSPTDITGPFSPDSAFYYNLFIQEYQKVNGIFTLVTTRGGLKTYRIPDLTPSGQNKTLIADISVTIEYPYTYADPLPFKEFRYEFYVVDRTFNLSNRDTSAVIVW